MTGPTTARGQDVDRRTPFRILLAVAVIVALLGSAAAGTDSLAATVTTTATPTAPADGPGATGDPGIVPDPTATAVPPSTPVDDPLQSGYTPQSVADAEVPGPAQTAPAITATGAVLFDPLDGVILAGVDPRVPRPMASTTKIMTVLLALEAVEAGLVAPQTTVSAFAAATGQLPGVATLDLEEGDVVDLRDLLAADLLRSGNDGAVAIAEHVAGSESAYVAMMNARSRSLGLEATSFADASGLTDDSAHVATPLDLALLGHEAMSHPDFATWAGADTLTIEPFGVLENRNELLGTYPGTTGIKTGFTSLAGLCLVASVERDGRTLYVVVLGSEDRVADSIALFDHGFEDFARPTPLQPGDVPAPGSYRTAVGEVPLAVAEELARTIGTGADVQMVTRLAPDVGLPIDVGTPLGVTVLLVDGEEVDRTPLLADAALAAPADSAGGALADAIRAFSRLGSRTTPVSL